MQKTNRNIKSPLPDLPGPWLHELVFDVYEARLVLSAQTLYDVDPFAASELNSISACSMSDHQGDIFTQGRLAEAHRESGLADAERLFGLGGENQTVAVIDSGIAWDHVALGGGFGPGYRVVGGWDFTDENDANPYDDPPAGFHGTHIAGIIGANDGSNFGVAPKADLVALRVFDDNGTGHLHWIENALRWVHQNRNAFEHPITTVNVSVGAGWNSDQLPSSAQFEDELKQLYDDGIVVVASAGNGFQQYHVPGLTYPAASPYVIPASSVDDDGELSDFSQRHSRAIAAPGSNILSTVPDHVLGKNGIINDWSEASGTSMAAPYLAGASVLVREAMEMAGIQSVNMDAIYQHLHQTADTVWDAITSQSYDRLNLHRAIDALIPDDNVDGSNGLGNHLALQNQNVSGWINTIGDRDVYSFTASQNGVFHVDLDSRYLSDTHWNIWEDGSQKVDQSGSNFDIPIVAGKSYEFGLSDGGHIGPFEFTVDWRPANLEGPGSDHSPESIALGEVAQLSREVVSAEEFSVRASHDGIMTVVVDSLNTSGGKLAVIGHHDGTSLDSTWESGQLRIDLHVLEGEELTLKMPDAIGWEGSLKITNLIERIGDTVHVQGLPNADSLQIDLSNQIQLTVNGASYRFDSQSVQKIEVDGSMEGDRIEILGSSLSEKVEMWPGSFSLENSQLTIEGTNIEEIHFSGGGGPDRVFLYDANTDDTLYSHAQESELQGIGYRYYVSNVNRTFFHATSGGQDIAFLYDSKGDDNLAVRPQFSSIRGDDYFNYVTGFDRVNVYATAGGNDSAELYDSAGDDRFNTSGDAASIVGANFFSYTRYFENVVAYATAGGNDLASLYAHDRSAFLEGADFASLNEDGLSRAARGFEQNAMTIVIPDGPLGFTTQSVDSFHHQSEPTHADGQLDIGIAKNSSVVEMALESSQSINALHSPLPAGELAPDKAEFDQDSARSSATSHSNLAQLLARAMENFGEIDESSMSADELLINNPKLESAILARLFARRG